MQASISFLYQGGLGNQLFIHAAYLFIASHNKHEALADITSRFEQDLHYKRTFRLLDLGLSPPRQCDPHLLVSNHRIMRWLARLILPKLGLSPKVVNDKLFSQLCNHPLLDSNKSYIFDGYFQFSCLSERVYKEIAAGIKKSLWERAEKRYKNLCGDVHEGVCLLHLRLFGDLLEEESVAFQYYEEAVTLVAKKFGLKTLFLLGVDTSAAFTLKTRLSTKFNIEVKIIKSESDIEDLVFIGLFKSLIASESTFSWWGAVIGELEGRVENVVLSGRHKQDGASSWVPEKLMRPGWHIV